MPHRQAKVPAATIPVPRDAAVPSGVAVFDLDGTLLAWDCQLLFRHFVVRRQRWRRLLLPVFLSASPAAPLLGCDRMKRLFLSYLWQMPPEQLSRLCREFAREIIPAMYPELLEIIRNHRERGDLLILASASPVCYVREIGLQLGFHHSLGTEVRIGPLVPPLSNHKGQAKVARLRELLPEHWFHEGKILHSHGYTDSTADLPMLALCETATVVNPKPKLAAIARRQGWRIIRPVRPWTSRRGWMARSLALLAGLGRDPGGLKATAEKNPETPRDTPPV